MSGPVSGVGPARRRASHRRRRPVPPSALPLLVVTVAVVAGNLLYLTGVFDPNPLYQTAQLTVSGTRHVLAGLDQIDPNTGYTAQALGHLSALDWLHGRVPWWNPYEGIGAPLAGEMEAAAFFPPVLFDVFSNGQVYFHLLLELIAGYSTYFLLRRLVRSRAAATAGAVAFALNGTFAWLFHASGNPVAFAPLLLLGIEQCLEPGPARGWRGWPLVALAVALSIYAGFPEVAYIDGLLALLWLAVRASPLRGRQLRSALSRSATGALVGTLVAGPALVSFVDYASRGYLGGHSSGFGGLWTNARLAVPSSLMPYVFGPLWGWGAHDPTGRIDTFWAYAGGYLGISLVVLALVGVVGRSNRRLRVALAVWVLLGVARSTGVPGALQLVDALPGISRTIFFRYAYPSWSLAVVVLAAMGIDDLGGRRRVRRSVVAGAVCLAGVGLAAFEAERVLRLVYDNTQKGLWAGSSIAFACFVTALVTAFSVVPGARLRRAGVSALVAVEALTLFVVPELSANRQVVTDTAAVAYLQAHLGTARFFTLGPVQPNYGSYWGLGEVNVNDLPIPESYARYVTGRLDPNADPSVFTGTTRLDPSGPTPAEELAAHLGAYEALGVRYLVARNSTALPAGLGVAPVYRDGLLTVYRLPHPAPFYLASAGCRVLDQSLSSAQVTCDRPGAVTRREQYLPGWSATDDGHGVPVRRAGALFQSVALHAGLNHLDFGYEPPGAGWAAAAAVASLAGVAGAGVSRARRRRGSRGSRGSAPRIWTEPSGTS